MKRMIVCEECSGRSLKLFEGEWFKRKKGTAKNKMLCDNCDKIINIGDKCAAESMETKYYKWETDYIELEEKTNPKPKTKKKKRKSYIMYGANYDRV